MKRMWLRNYQFHLSDQGANLSKQKPLIVERKKNVDKDGGSENQRVGAEEPTGDQDEEPRPRFTKY